MTRSLPLSPITHNLSSRNCCWQTLSWMSSSLSWHERHDDPTSLHSVIWDSWMSVWVEFSWCMYLIWPENRIIYIWILLKLNFKALFHSPFLFWAHLGPTHWISSLHFTFDLKTNEGNEAADDIVFIRNITANDNINVANEDIVIGLEDEVGNTATNMSPQWEVWLIMMLLVEVGYQIFIFS